VHQSLKSDVRFFSVNGKTDGGTGGDMATQILVGQLPVMLHPRPDDVLVVGLGTGITLKALGSHPTKKITCVEISPEVVKAERYFREDNGYALKDPKVTLVVNDGRNHLFTRPHTYDVIISQPSNPWQTGNANLFTDDFYRLAARRLKKGGIFSQWIGLYDITPENLKTASRTFMNTFPNVLVFKSHANLILIGSMERVPIDYLQLVDRFSVPKIKQVMNSIGIESPADLIASQYLYTEKNLESFAGQGVLNSDDLPVLEYSARFNLGENVLGELKNRNLAALDKSYGERLVLPLQNFGDSPEVAAENLRMIGKCYADCGKLRIAEQFMRKAADYK
jgi:spermidine synthase